MALACQSSKPCHHDAALQRCNISGYAQESAAATLYPLCMRGARFLWTRGEAQVLEHTFELVIRDGALPDSHAGSAGGEVTRQGSLKFPGLGRNTASKERR